MKACPWTDSRKHLQRDHLSYAQTLQDVFALAVNDYKFNGTCLDIGSAGPVDMYNNSKLLQLFNWSCIAVDMGNFSSGWAPFVNCQFYQKSMTEAANVDEIISKCPEVVDYLSIDIDDYTLGCLKLIDLEKIKFRCITIEHNKYLGSRGDQRHEQRLILEDAGYLLWVKNWSKNCPYEDWWIHPDLVNVGEVKKFNELDRDTALDYLLDVDLFCDGHREKIKECLPRFNQPTLKKLK